MERKSWLPEGGTNLFQEIKAICNAAEAKGQKLYKLSIGQPSGPALLPAREFAADAVQSDDEQMHEYQDNGSPGLPGFAERFVNCHIEANVYDLGVECLPIPGIKPMLSLIPLACGSATRDISVMTTTNPGYPTPADWCGYLRLRHKAINLSPMNDFLVDPQDIILNGYTDLLMVNYPHNPSARVATREMWKNICEFAQTSGTRIFNDGAYSILAHTPDHCTLTDVAKDFPGLSWAEAFSASKAGNFKGSSHLLIAKEY